MKLEFLQRLSRRDLFCRSNGRFSTIRFVLIDAQLLHYQISRTLLELSLTMPSNEDSRRAVAHVKYDNIGKLLVDESKIKRHGCKEESGVE